MLERRVSNQRQDLSSDQQMNYLLSWFVNWSDLQKVSESLILSQNNLSDWPLLGLEPQGGSKRLLDGSKRGPRGLLQCSTLD